MAHVAGDDDGVCATSLPAVIVSGSYAMAPADVDGVTDDGTTAALILGDPKVTSMALIRERRSRPSLEQTTEAPGDDEGLGAIGRSIKDGLHRNCVPTSR